MKEIMVSILDNCTSIESDRNPFVFLENKESINSFHQLLLVMWTTTIIIVEVLP